MKKFIAGVMIGVANVIPTVSGAAMAVLFDRYQDFLDVTGNFYLPKTWKRHLSLILGILVGIVLSILVISFLYERVPHYLVFFFVGIIVSGIFDLETKLTVNSFKNILLAIIALILMLWLSLSSQAAKIDYNNLIVLGFMGGLSALATLLPGAGGSLLMMLLGIYFPILEGCKKVITDFSSWGSSEFWMVFIFAVGFVLGMVIFSKLIKGVMKKYPDTFKYISFGLIVATAFSVLWHVNYHQIDVMDTFIIITCFAFGFIGMGYLSKKLS